MTAEDTGEARLLRLGLRQEFRREFTLLTNFGMWFRNTHTPSGPAAKYSSVSCSYRQGSGSGRIVQTFIQARAYIT